MSTKTNKLRVGHSLYPWHTNTVLKQIVTYLNLDISIRKSIALHISVLSYFLPADVSSLMKNVSLITRYLYLRDPFL